ncbi:MAG: XRE family transcriptional regulator [Bacteroidetes bacterium]|nr:MAG: XRE family transcriptional regulator [Bacteroidota bacterium]
MNKFSIEKLPSDILRETAEKHRKLRKQKKLTQADLAKKTGVSLGSIKRFETTGKISFESLLKLAQVLGRLNDFEKIFMSSNDLETVEKLFSDKTRK